jgi:hypothetical protein
MHAYIQQESMTVLDTARNIASLTHRNSAKMSCGPLLHVSC